MISENLKIRSNNRETFTKYTELLSEMMYAIDGLPHTERNKSILSSCKSEMSKERQMLSDKLNNYAETLADFDLSTVKIGNIYKCIEKNYHSYDNSKTVTYMQITDICEYEDKTWHIEYNSISINKHNIDAYGDIVKDDSYKNRHQTCWLPPFIAKIADGKYIRVTDDEWNKAAEMYAAYYEFYNSLIITE